MTQVNDWTPWRIQLVTVQYPLAIRGVGFTFALQVAVAGCGFAAGLQSDLSAQVKADRGLVEFHFRGAKLCSYVFATNQFKPYMGELYSLRGDNVLRDAPADHLHHHGLMYAIRVNGVNFWEERDEPGHERHVKLTGPHTSRSASGLPQASFTEIIHWVPHGEHTLAETAGRAFLIEQRTITLIVNEPEQETALAWHAEFQVGGRTNRVTLHGSDYNGLGLRLPESWDRAARHENSEGTSSLNGGRPGAVPARWGAVSHTANGRAMQVVLLARPRSHPGTNAFFTMTEPFTYLSATLSLDKTPLAYRSGDRFSLDYLVLVYPVARPRAQIEERYQSWVRELKSSAPTASKVSSER